MNENNNIFNTVNSSPELSDSVKYYWGYQYRLGEDVLVPALINMNAFHKEDKIIEIGCAEGGVLSAFLQNGASYAVGTDIAEKRIEYGEQIAKLTGQNLLLSYHNILSDKVSEEWNEKFDMAILRDVIEHLNEPYTALFNIKDFLKKSGYLFVTFPPYHSPFGGHQHTLKNSWGKLPYIHLLPEILFNMMIKSGRKADIEEVKRLRDIRLTIDKFKDAVKKSGYEIVNSEYYLLRPVFKMKFGLPALSINALAAIPFIRKYFCMEAAFLLRKK